MRTYFKTLVPSLLAVGLAAALLPAISLAQGEVKLQDGNLVFTGASGQSTAIHQPAGEVTGLQTLVRGPVVAVTWLESGVPSFATSLDGGQSFGRARETSYQITLRYAQFDPLVDAVPAVPAGLQAAPGAELYIVQYVAKGAEAWRDEIRALGGVDHRFLAQHANVWRLSPAAAAAVAELPFVRWVGPFHPAYKLEDELLAAYHAGGLEARLYNVEVAEWGAGDKAIVKDAIAALGGEVVAAVDEGWIVEAFLTPEQMLAVARMNEVLGIDRKGEPGTDMNNVRSLMGGNYVETAGGYTGTGVRAEVFDGGLTLNRAEWKYPPVQHGTVSDDSHGTSTYSINFANTTSAARGMCPDAQGIIADYTSYGGNRYTHTAQLVNPTLTYKAVYQSNSWGDPQTSVYTSISQQMDDIIFINDINIFQSQSNLGNTSSRPQAWAKNIMAVGGINHYNNTSNTDDRWANGASTGPAQDGRVKPDMCAFYDQTNTVNNSAFGGTSGATPTVAGHTGLFFQMWHNGIFGNPTGATVFDSRPHSSTARAFMINSAWQYPDTQGDITRMRQGWGRPDLQWMYDNRSKTVFINETAVLADNQSTAYQVDVTGASEFRATMVYLDRAGTTSSTLHRINDLSLKVTSPTGTVYWGNNGMSNTTGSYNYSTSGGVSNTKDCVENVRVQNPGNGTWLVEVYADEVNQDTHLETGTVDADFALVVTPAVISGGGGGTNTITLVGPTLAFPGSTVTWNWSGAPATGTWYALYSLNLGPTNISGHTFDIGSPFTAGASGPSTSSSGSYTATLPAGASGKTINIEWGVVDAASNVFDSNMLAMTVL